MITKRGLKEFLKKKKKKERKLGRTDEINALIKYYKKMEILLAKKENNKNDFVESWLKCLNDLNIKIIN